MLGSVCAVEKLCLDIVPVRVSNAGLNVLTHALLDQRSSCMSFSELDLSGMAYVVETSAETLTTDKPEYLSSESFSFHVLSLDGIDVFHLA